MNRFPAPRSRQTAFLAISDPAAACRLLGRARRHSGDAVTSLEYVTRSSLELVLELDAGEGFGDRALAVLAGHVGHGQGQALLLAREQRRVSVVDVLQLCQPELAGRDLVAGIPKVVVATSEEIREALENFGVPVNEVAVEASPDRNR